MCLLFIGFAAMRIDCLYDRLNPQPDNHIDKNDKDCSSASNVIDIHLGFITAALADVMQPDVLDISVLLKQ
jgi:hypothetical protein